MKHTATITACAALLCGCIHEFPQDCPGDVPPVEYTCEDILVSEAGRQDAWADGELTLRDDRVFVIHPYPNRNAPVEVSSSDTTVILPRLDADTLRLERRSPGEALVTLTCCGTSRDILVRNHRTMEYDITYDPSSDLLALRLDGTDDDGWTDARMHVTVIWCSRVGFGSNYMNTRYPLTTVIEDTAGAGEEIPLVRLQEQYRKVKALHDEEYARETARDPKHDWASWSGISLKVVIRQECRQLELIHARTGRSAYGYSLGFKLEHTQIHD